MWHSFWHWYFDPKPFETVGDCRLYRFLGIRLFKRYLPTSGDVVSRWQGISRIRRADGGLEHALRRYERVTRSYEARHIFGALSMFAISWWSITFHSKGEWSALLAANALINGYPIILQRYNRIRLQNTLARFSALRSRHRERHT
jgi:hypothetical protein